MPTIRIEVPSIQQPIQTSPGFAKKQLSDYKLDILGLCQFGCRYCSSNWGNYLRINRNRFADLTEQQVGQRLLPTDEPSLMFAWPDVLEQLDKQLQRVRPGFGAGKTLVFSMLTDGFSPAMVKEGVTQKALRMVLERTEFRIRVLTKNAIVGSDSWIEFFRQHPDRFVVGLSTGTLDDQWAKRVEVGTSLPSARLRALRNLQDAGVPTYGMLCPVFPGALENGSIQELIEQCRPGHDTTEHVWAEPYNDRHNWKAVAEWYDRDSTERTWFEDVYLRHQSERWSRYAIDLFFELRNAALAAGWMHKLRYLLYEDCITGADAQKLGSLHGVLLQSKPAPGGRSANSSIAALQSSAPAASQNSGF